jgi:hypothetical protein
LTTLVTGNAGADDVAVDEDGEVEVVVEGGLEEDPGLSVTAASARTPTTAAAPTPISAPLRSSLREAFLAESGSSLLTGSTPQASKGPFGYFCFAQLPPPRTSP